IFHTFKRVELIEEDVLDVDLSEIFGGGVNKIVANLPYSVGSRFIVNALEANPLPQKMVFMVQKEVADRLTAQPGGKTYGPLAIWSQLNYAVKNIKNVSPKCFMPAPKVWSAVVRFEKRETPLAEVKDYARFKKLVKTAFTQRRKQIGSNVRKNLPEFFQGLEKAGIDPTTRPEQIAIEQWAALAQS
ncbi:MAG TPA: 16S rRNA (adenine(1518)-N(6)/adenine(1519)-N(6))-dimethyltransferase RsmA, partial [Tichowtungia sp.]|nr:16S rRNA (adenine(1518)-N(6)/adenine(1519)-N(6))-dimethyltransferase RsmA [Tichowtungia sp.]